MLLCRCANSEKLFNLASFKFKFLWPHSSLWSTYLLTPPPSIPRCINCLFLTFRLNPDIPIEVAVASPQREISAAAWFLNHNTHSSLFSDSNPPIDYSTLQNPHVLFRPGERGNFRAPSLILSACNQLKELRQQLCGQIKFKGKFHHNICVW